MRDQDIDLPSLKVIDDLWPVTFLDLARKRGNAQMPQLVSDCANLFQVLAEDHDGRSAPVTFNQLEQAAQLGTPDAMHLLIIVYQVTPTHLLQLADLCDLQGCSGVQACRHHCLCDVIIHARLIAAELHLFSDHCQGRQIEHVLGHAQCIGLDQ